MPRQMKNKNATDTTVTAREPRGGLPPMPQPIRLAPPSRRNIKICTPTIDDDDSWTREDTRMARDAVPLLF